MQVSCGSGQGVPARPAHGAGSGQNPWVLSPVGKVRFAQGWPNVQGGEGEARVQDSRQRPGQRDRLAGSQVPPGAGLTQISISGAQGGSLFAPQGMPDWVGEID